MTCTATMQRRGTTMPTSEQADETAEVGDLVHDLGSGPYEGWFIVGDGGYWDVDNACWVEDDPDDAPWTNEFFQLLGSAADRLCLPPREQVQP